MVFRVGLEQDASDSGYKYGVVLTYQSVEKHTNYIYIYLERDYEIHIYV